VPSTSLARHVVASRSDVRCDTVRRVVHQRLPSGAPPRRTGFFTYVRSSVDLQASRLRVQNQESVSSHNLVAQQKRKNQQLWLLQRATVVPNPGDQVRLVSTAQLAELIRSTLARFTAVYCV
jgi:hypothetical protein